MATTPLQSFPIPALGDAADAAADFLAFGSAVEKQVVLTFTSITARTAAVPTPVPGMISYLQDLGRVDVCDPLGNWVITSYLTKTPRVHVYANAGLPTLGFRTNATLNFDSEAYDPENMHSPTTNPSRITVPVTGVYQCHAGVTFAVGSATQAGFRALVVRLNGTSTVALRYTSGADEFITATASFDIPLNANDYLEVQASQGEDTSLALIGGSSYSTFFQLRWVSA